MNHKFLSALFFIMITVFVLNIPRVYAVDALTIEQARQMLSTGRNPDGTLATEAQLSSANRAYYGTNGSGGYYGSLINAGNNPSSGTVGAGTQTSTGTTQTCTGDTTTNHAAAQACADLAIAQGRARGYTNINCAVIQENLPGVNPATGLSYFLNTVCTFDGSTDFRNGENRQSAVLLVGYDAGPTTSANPNTHPSHLNPSWSLLPSPAVMAAGGNASGTNPSGSGTGSTTCLTGDIFNRVTGVRCSGANSSNPPTGTNTPPAGTNTTPNLISGTNSSVSITATPGTFANGKWTYTFVWNRARDAQGTFIVTPVSSPNTITLKVDPAAKNNSSIPATAQLDPSTAYLAEYYNLPQCSKTDIDCVVIASATFTTLSSTGTPPAPTSNNNGNNSNSSDISSLQAQINALTAQIAQLIALIAGNGITPVVSTGGNTNTLVTTPANSNTTDVSNGATITTPAALPAGTVGSSYQNGSFKMIVTCRTSNIFQWVLSEGNLPGGMQLALTGELTGTPTTPGTFVFRARAVSQAAYADASRVFTVTINPSN